MALLLGFCKTCNNTEQGCSGQWGDISFWADCRWADLALLKFHLVRVPDTKLTALNQHAPKCGVLSRFHAKSFIKKNACLCEVRRFRRTIALLVLQTPTVFLITTRLLTAHDTDMYAVLAQSSPDRFAQARKEVKWSYSKWHCNRIRLSQRENVHCWEIRLCLWETVETSNFSSQGDQ